MHGQSIRFVEIALHLFDEIVIGIKLEMFVESFIVIAMASFYLAIVSRCSRFNTLMLNPQLLTKKVKWVDLLGLSKVCKFNTIICLQDFGLITKMTNSQFQKLNRRMRALLFKRIDKSLSGSFVDDSILIEFIRDRAGVTVFWDIFDIHLPFHSDFGRRMVGLWFVGFFLFLEALKKPNFLRMRKREQGCLW